MPKINGRRGFADFSTSAHTDTHSLSLREWRPEKMYTPRSPPRAKLYRVAWVSTFSKILYIGRDCDSYIPLSMNGYGGIKLPNFMVLAKSRIVFVVTFTHYYKQLYTPLQKYFVNIYNLNVLVLSLHKRSIFILKGLNL